MTKKLYSRTDIAHILRIHPATVRNWYARGIINIRPTYTDQTGNHPLYNETDLKRVVKWYHERNK